jgi:hypothetical protein
MERDAQSAFIIGLSTCIVFFVTGVFYCLSQHRALATVQPRNRRIAPGLVWLQFIPFLGQVWQLFVIIFIADSFRTELESHREDSLLGINAEAVEHLGERPTLTFGLLFFFSWIILICFNLWYSGHAETGTVYFIVNFIPLILALSSLTFFVLYWVKLVRTKQRIGRLRP